MDLSALIPLATGGAGGLIGGNLLGALTRSGAGTNSIVGMIGGALATYFFGPTIGPMIGPVIGGLVSDGSLTAILSNLVTGAGGGGVLSLVIGLIRSMMSR